MTESKEDGLRALLKKYDEAVEWHSYSPHNVNREAEQHEAAARLAEGIRAHLSASSPPVADAMVGGVLVLGTPEYRDYINRRGHEPDRRASPPPVGGSGETTEPIVWTNLHHLRRYLRGETETLCVTRKREREWNMALRLSQSDLQFVPSDLQKETK